MASAIKVKPLMKMSHMRHTKANTYKELIKDMDTFVIDTLEKNSVELIIDELLAMLPYEPQDRDQNILEVAAEKLYTLRETDFAANQFTLEALNEILENAVLRTEIVEDIGEMLKEITEQIPLHFILQREIILTIVKKITSSYANLRKDELANVVQSLTSSQKDEIETVLDHILEEVFGPEIDYLYYIKDL